MKQKTYVYIIRWWSEDPKEVDTWRFVLETSLTQQKEAFTQLEALLTAIQQGIEKTMSDNPDQTPPS